jgi:hypothetical protein
VRAIASGAATIAVGASPVIVNQHLMPKYVMITMWTRLFFCERQKIMKLLAEIPPPCYHYHLTLTDAQMGASPITQNPYCTNGTGYSNRSCTDAYLISGATCAVLRRSI